MTDQLEQYQLDGASFLAARQRAGLFDEPGVGKTAQAIRASELVKAKSILVVCPAGVRQIWPHQWRLWGRTAPRIVKANTIFDVLAWLRGQVDVLIVSFEQAVNWQKDLSAEFFDLLIVDESHYLKNAKAKRTVAIVGPQGDGVGGIGGMAGAAWLLTGTPKKNDPSDFWVPLRFTRATERTFSDFTKRYFTSRSSTFSTFYSIKKEAIPEFRVVLGSVSLMRTMADVGMQLPPARLDPWPIDGDDRGVVDYLKDYPGLSERIVRSLEGEGKLAFEDNTHVATLRALIAEAKAPGYSRVVCEELKQGVIEKLVIMGHHRRGIHMIVDHLRRNGIDAAAIVGDTPETERKRIVESFQEDEGGVRVIVGNIISAGTGLTLTAAHRVDMFESAWTPSENVQAIRRVRRKGQVKNVLVRFVMLNDSFDQTVAKIVARKANENLRITGKDINQEAMV